MPRIAAVVAVVFLLRAGLSIEAQDTFLRLGEAETATSLTDGGVPPWYLKIAAQLYDEKGNPSEQGIIEEWWAGPGTEKRVYTFPSYTATEVHESGKLYRSRGAPTPPELIDLLLQQVVHPMPSSPEIVAARPDLQQVKLGQVPLDCIMLSQPIEGLKSAPLGLFPTYCFDVGRNSLRASYNYGTQLILRNGIGTFHGKSVPMEVTVRDRSGSRAGDVLTATGRITALMTDKAASSPFQIDDLAEIDTKPVEMGADTVKARLLKKVEPIYPEEAKQRQLSGQVVLHVIIGTDGRVHDITVKSSTDPYMAVASVAAVRRWQYAPYVVNGVPFKVATSITLNFSTAPWFLYP